MSSPSVETRAIADPRFLHAPPAVTTATEDVADLAASVDLHLDAAQIAALEAATGERADRSWAADQVAIVEPRQNGKTALLAARALAGLYVFEEPLIVWTAHRLSTALEGFRQMRALVENYDHLSRRLKGRPHRTTFGTGEIELLNGARLLFMARAAGASGRGLSVDCLFLDEAYDLTDDDLAAMLPALSARPNHQVWYTSSAPKDHSEVLRRICKAGRYGTAPRLAYAEWCATDDAASDDREAWRAANPAFPSRIDEDTILGELAVMSDADFRRERLGIWSEEVSGAVIDPAAWAKLADAESRRADGADLALGVDISPLRDYAAVGVYAPRADGLGHTQLVDYRPGVEWLIPRIAELRDALNPLAVGMGRGTYESLKVELADLGITRPEDPDKPKRGDLAVTSATDMAAACGQIIDAVRQGTLRHVGQRPLDVAVAGAKTRQTGDTIAWSRRDVDVDVSPLVAVTVARWAYESRAHVKKPAPATAVAPRKTTSNMFRPGQRLKL